MDLTYRPNAGRRSSATKTNTSLLARAMTGLSLRSRDVETEDEVRGPFGLNLLYTPSEPIVDLIFVHGLGGGSRRTWSKSTDVTSFWPQEWLPRDVEFKHTRVHSFGYNSNWSEKGQSVLNMIDFAKSLLGAMKDCPHLKKSPENPIIFVGHSMGGLVIKQACILAKDDPTFQELRRRFHAIFFMATPHRGSDYAQLLRSILTLSGLGSKPFVPDLQKQSASLQSINEVFRHCCESILLFSFYETRPPVPAGPLIVEKISATLDYPSERSSLLNADHRNVVKYDSPEDPNFVTVRNALVGVIEDIQSQCMFLSAILVVQEAQLNLVGSLVKSEQYRTERRQLEKFVGVSGRPEDELISLDELRIPGTCEWLCRKTSYREWRDSGPARIFWLQANPASGKSVMAAYIIGQLEDANLSCSYYFFNHNNKSESRIGSCFRSLAYQMALLYPNFRQGFLAMYRDVQLDKDNYLAIWRRLFTGCIFDIGLDQPHYWVIDALDECRNHSELMPLLLKIEESVKIKIFITSRFSPVIPMDGSGRRLTLQVVTPDDTLDDIRRFVNRYTHNLPLEDPRDRNNLVTTILQKAAGCFLWVRLVLDELAKVHGSADIKKVLEDVPQGMENLYDRTINTLGEVKYGKDLAKAVLIWVVCATRPLTTDELKEALKFDLKESFTNFEKSIVSLVGQLVWIDHQNRVKIVHQTAKDFLLDPGLESSFAVDRQEGNRRVAEACLRYLTGDEMKQPRGRKLSTSQIRVKRSPFANYACSSFYEHVAVANAENEEILSLLGTFLGSSNVLAWIEHVASNAGLKHMIQAAKALKNFLDRRAKHISPLGRNPQIVDAWGTDLIRIAAKFGQNLAASPSTIYHLIPPFCPPETAAFKQFGAQQRGLVVSGLSATGWDDALSCIVYGEEETAAVACDENMFAVGLRTGALLLYNRATCQRVQNLEHGERIQILCFSSSNKLLACAGVKQLRVWNVATGEEVFHQPLETQLLALTFLENDKILMGASRQNHLLEFDLHEKLVLQLSDWDDGGGGYAATAARVPVAAAFSAEHNMLGVVYRGRPILLWDLQNDAFLGECGPEITFTTGKRKVYTIAVALVFNPAPNTSLLAAAYQSGDLVLIDPIDGSVQVSVIADAQTLACTPDGRTLASGDAAGTIQLFDFESLKLLYRMSYWGHGIRSIAFSSDSLQFIDIRGPQCNVWEPPILVRQHADEGNSDTISTTPKEISTSTLEELVTVTMIVCHPSLNFVFCARDDGTVSVYDAISGRLRGILYRHGDGISVTSLAFDADTGSLLSTDSSSRVLGYKLGGSSRQLKCEEVIVDFRHSQAIHQTVIKDGLDYLLVSSADTDTIHLPSGKITASRSHSARRAWNWTKCQKDLMLIVDRSISIHDWVSLSTKAAYTVTLPDHIQPAFGLKYFASCWSNKLLTMRFSDPRAIHSATRLFFLDTAVFKSPSSTDFPDTAPQVLLPTSLFLSLSDRIANFIGMLNGRILFLDERGWICSAELETWTGDFYSRHFFLPSDWLSSSRELHIEITAKGDLAFAQRGEVAVVRRGLDYAENANLMDINSDG